jgi:diguanylate cyclase (GGDEF)-like protein
MNRAPSSMLRSFLAALAAPAVLLPLVAGILFAPLFSESGAGGTLYAMLLVLPGPVNVIVICSVLLLTVVAVAGLTALLVRLVIVRPMIAAGESLSRSLHRSRQMDEMKNEFISNVTHDFRSPLTVILNKSDLMLRFDRELPEKNRDGIALIHESATRLEDSVDRLLNLAKHDWKGIELYVQQVDPAGFIGSICQFYEQVLYDTGIKFIQDIEAGPIDDFFTDTEKLEEILDNIISNAIKFVDNENGEITLQLTGETTSISISVIDNGIGIESGQLESIFDRFKQAPSSAGRIGSGIGLAYSRKLVDALHGSVSAASDGAGTGARFTVTLPRGKSGFTEAEFNRPPHQRSHREKMQQIIGSIINSKNESSDVTVYMHERNGENEYDHRKAVILIADPSREARGILMEYLLHSGFTNFITASDGMDALQAVYDYRPDIVLCEFNVPGLSGDGLFSMLKANPDFNRIPVVLVSAVPAKKIAKSLGLDDTAACLSKPINEKELMLTVSMYLSRYFEYRRSHSLLIIDELTGVFNRRTVLQNLKKTLSRRVLQALSVVYFDIDNMKKINDEIGFQQGDRFLSGIGQMLKKSLRDYDIVGRFTGGKFIMILPESDARQARLVSEKIRIKIRKLHPGGTHVRLTASFGIASLIDNGDYLCQLLDIPSLEAVYPSTERSDIDWSAVQSMKLQLAIFLLEMAEDAMYKAKQNLCRDCGYASSKAGLFTGARCPMCGSKNVLIGQDRVLSFGDGMA